MSPFDALAGIAISTIQSIFGSSTAFVYSRSAGQQFDAVPGFVLAGALNAGGAYASPEGKVDSSLMVKPSDIPLGPQKGDTVTIAAAPAPMKSGIYRVQEIIMDPVTGWANLELRYVCPS